VPEDDNHHRRTAAARAKQQYDPRRRVLGNAIKNARIARGYSSQRRLAEAFNISERSLADAEVGKKVISERSLADAEVGKKVSLATLIKIEVIFGWPVGMMTAYLEGDDEALKALPALGIPSAAAKRLADAGLTIDVVPVPFDVAVTWLTDLRVRLSDDPVFFGLVDQLSRPSAPEDAGSTESNETG
jgi:hypothetical protein